MTIGERIKNRRTELGLSVDDVASRLGKNRATIYRYENGFIEDMPTSVLESLAKVLFTTPADLMGWDDSEMPVLGRVAAGEPSEMIEDIKYRDDDFKRNMEEYFTLEIHGDSMAPWICEGDTVLVHKQETAESGDIVVATINGDAATCKRLKIREDGIELKPDNESYAPFVFSKEDVERLPVRISGKVVELKREL